MVMFRRIWNVFTSILIALVVVLAILLAGVRLIGFTPFVVLSGSMEPEIKTGSIVYDRKVKPEDIEVGDVITYMLSEDTLSTHRVVEVLETEPHENNPTGIKYKVKGDANKDADPQAVMHSNVVGEVKFHIPYLGYVHDFIFTPPRTYIAIGIGVLLLILIFLPEILFGPEKKEKKGKGGKAEEKAEEIAQGNAEPIEAPAEKAEKAEEKPAEDSAE